MKHYIILIAIACSLVLFTNPAEAATGTAWFRMTRLQSVDGGIHVYFPTGLTYVNNANCTNPYHDSYLLSATDPNYQTKAATIMAAFLSDREVFLYISDTECNGAHPKIVTIYSRIPQ